MVNFLPCGIFAACLLSRAMLQSVTASAIVIIALAVPRRYWSLAVGTIRLKLFAMPEAPAVRPPMKMPASLATSATAGRSEIGSWDEVISDILDAED